LRAQHLHLGHQAGAPAALLDAARERHELFDHEGALSLLLMYAGIDYAEQAPHAHAMLLGDVYAKMGQMPQARQAYERAIATAPDAVSGLSAKVALAGVLNVLEDLAAEETLIDQALPEAGALRAHAQLATLHYLKGNLYFPRGDVARSRMHHARAMTVAQEAGAARVQAQALSGLGDSYYAEGLMGTANAHFVRCLLLCDEHGLRDIEASNRFMLATTQIYLCQTGEALTQALASAELARRVGNRRAEIVSRLTAGWVELSCGRPREALIHIDEGLMISRGMGATRFEPFLQESQARAQYALGDEAQAQRTIQAALDSVERLKLHAFIGPWVLGTWALLHHPDGRAMQALARGEALIEQGCVAHNIYRFHACAMEAHVLAGRHDLVEQVGQRWLARTAAEPMPRLHAAMPRAFRPATSRSRRLAASAREAGLARHAQASARTAAVIRPAGGARCSPGPSA
jgi:tetratricopeptide (TPR) repeat protein